MQHDTDKAGAQYIRNTQPSLLSTIIFGILSIQKYTHPLTLASMEDAHAPLVIKRQYANAVVQRVHTTGIDIVSVCSNQADNHHFIYFIHGGAWASGLNDRYVDFAIVLSQKTRYCVMMPDFSLLPSAHFPTALNEIEVAYEWLQHTDSPNRTVVGGDSSGGNLSAALVFKLEEDHLPLPAAQFLFSPLADLTLASPTFKSRASVDPMLTVSFVRDAVQAYIGGNTSEVRDPLASPLNGDFHQYPPTIIEAADQEIFLGDSLELYGKITAAGSQARLEVWNGLWHAFPIVTSVPEAREALDNVAQYIDATVKD